MSATPPFLRENISLSQPYKRHKSFTHTNTGDTAETAVSLTSVMEEGNKVALIVDLYDAYIEFDADASSSTMLIPAGTGYFDDSIQILTKISIKNASAGKNARIRGCVWGR